MFRLGFFAMEDIPLPSKSIDILFTQGRRVYSTQPLHECLYLHNGRFPLNFFHHDTRHVDLYLGLCISSLVQSLLCINLSRFFRGDPLKSYLALYPCGQNLVYVRTLYAEIFNQPTLRWFLTIIFHRPWSWDFLARNLAAPWPWCCSRLPCLPRTPWEFPSFLEFACITLLRISIVNIVNFVFQVLPQLVILTIYGLPNISPRTTLCQFSFQFYTFLLPANPF